MRGLNMFVRKSLIAFFLLVSFVGCGLLEDWKVFESKEGKFSVLMPGKVESLSQLVRLPAGWVDIKLFSAGGKDKISYMVSCSDYSEKIFSLDATSDAFLDSARDGAVANVKGVLLKEMKINMGKFPGRELRIDFDRGKATISSRLFLVNRRLYQVMVFTPKDKSDSKKIGKFMNSFELM